MRDITVVIALIFSHFAALAQENIQLSNDPALGQVLTDAEGNTLYFFTKDASVDNSACMGGCVDIWPIFHVANLNVGAGLDATDFGSFERADGEQQTTYKGWPLYYFANDNAPGDTNGEGVNDVWFVAKPDYGIMLMNNQLIGLDGMMYNSNYEVGTEEVQYFVDASGRTLYTWVNDNYDDNNFTAEDFSNNGVWPVYEEDLQQIPSILDATLFNTIDVHGHQQLTYKGWPLYYFGQDAERGETKGVSVPMPGIWPVAVQDIEAAVISIVQEIEELEYMKVAPNPFSNSISVTIDMLDVAELKVSLYNSIGQEVKTLWNGATQAGSNTFYFNDLLNLEEGLYFISIKDTSGGVKSVPLIRS